MQASTTENDGAIGVRTSSGDKLADSLLIEGKEDWSKGGGANPQAQLIAYYAEGIVSRCNGVIVRGTVCPAFGLEVFGNVLRSLLFAYQVMPIKLNLDAGWWIRVNADVNSAASGLAGASDMAVMPDVFSIATCNLQSAQVHFVHSHISIHLLCMQCWGAAPGLN